MACHISSAAPAEEPETLLSSCISPPELSVQTIQSHALQKRREGLRNMSVFLLFFYLRFPSGGLSAVEDSGNLVVR